MTTNTEPAVSSSRVCLGGAGGSVVVDVPHTGTVHPAWVTGPDGFTTQDPRRIDVGDQFEVVSFGRTWFYTVFGMSSDNCHILAVGDGGVIRHFRA